MSSLLTGPPDTGAVGSGDDPRIVRMLTPDGARTHGGEYERRIADLTPEALLALFEDMVVVRRIDETATTLQRQGELALWPPLLGQEAAQIGSARALRRDDFVFTSYRENAVAWVRGASPTDLVRVWRGVAATGWDPYEIGMATPQVVIGAHTLHATGYALGIQNDGADAVAVAYLGDGAMSEGDTAEAMVFAASFGAPVVFLCQNNQWAISEPVTLQAPGGIGGRAAGFGIPSVTVDGNDVLAVLAVTREALERARSGGGPSFIEAVTYRMGPHTTADDPTRYRDPEELERWRRRDPIDRLRTHLRTTGLLTDEAEQRVAAKAEAVAREMRAGCIALPDPDPMTLFDHVYAEPHSGIERERRRTQRYLAAFSDEEPAR